MSKISIDRHTLNGATMGTRWSAVFYAGAGFDPAPVQKALQATVEEVDAIMSTWHAQSDLMRLNAAPLGDWVAVPDPLEQVLRLGLQIGRASGGAFDIGMGDAVNAWGFGPEQACSARIRRAMTRRRQPAFEVLEIATGRVRKSAPIVLDLNGIAKGYGVDRLAQTLGLFGITDALVGIDGEMRAMGLQPENKPWNVAVDSPDPDTRAPCSILALQEAAVATSGDYRHWVTVEGQRLSHTMDPRNGAPLLAPPASATVVARSCAEADAWASALMVLGAQDGAEVARRHGLNALILTRCASGALHRLGVGPLFETASPTSCASETSGPAPSDQGPVAAIKSG